MRVVVMGSWLRISLSSACLVLLIPLPMLAQPSVGPGSTEDAQEIGHQVRSLAYLPSPSNLPLPPPLLPEELPEGLPEDISDAVRLVLKLGERRVYVYQGDRVQTSYPVAVGRSGWETPTGRFQILTMLSHPGWTNPLTGERVSPGPTNPLGERWIGFWTDGQNYIGFHGTSNRDSVGQAVSHGCVRMFNEDIRMLYDLVAVGTPVLVEQ